MTPGQISPQLKPGQFWVLTSSLTLLRVSNIDNDTVIFDRWNGDGSIGQEAHVAPVEFKYIRYLHYEYNLCWPLTQQPMAGDFWTLHFNADVNEFVVAIAPFRSTLNVVVLSDVKIDINKPFSLKPYQLVNRDPVLKHEYYTNELKQLFGQVSHESDLTRQEITQILDETLTDNVIEK